MSLWYCSQCGNLVPYEQLSRFIERLSKTAGETDYVICNRCYADEERLEDVLEQRPKRTS